jgi:hypothetical protein
LAVLTIFGAVFSIFSLILRHRNLKNKWTNKANRSHKGKLKWHLFAGSTWDTLIQLSLATQEKCSLIKRKCGLSVGKRSWVIPYF